jgi:hypothetical protein
LPCSTAAITALGDAIVGSRVGRSSDDDITLFESVGVGLQDLSTAELVIARAEERGLGGAGRPRRVAAVASWKPWTPCCTSPETSGG